MAEISPLRRRMIEDMTVRNLFSTHEQPQKWSNMANLGLSHHRRWRGVALGGHLQRGCRFCLASHNGQATTRRRHAGVRHRTGPRFGENIHLNSYFANPLSRNQN